LVVGGAEGLRVAGKLPFQPAVPLPNWYGLLFAQAALVLGLLTTLSHLARLASWKKALAQTDWLKTTRSQPQDGDPWWVAQFREALGQLENRHARETVVTNVGTSGERLRQDLNAQLAPAVLVAFVVPVAGFLVRWANIAWYGRDYAAADYSLALFWGTVEMIPVVLLTAFTYLSGRTTFHKWATLASAEIQKRVPSAGAVTQNQTTWPEVRLNRDGPVQATRPALPPSQPQPQPITKQPRTPPPQPTPKSTTAPPKPEQQPKVEKLREEDSILPGMSMDDL
jgi:hypothetical protein